LLSVRESLAMAPKVFGVSLPRAFNLPESASFPLQGGGQAGEGAAPIPTFRIPTPALLPLKGREKSHLCQTGFLLVASLLLLPVAAQAGRKSPVDGGVVTSGVGWRLDPFGSGRKVWHNGYDIAVPNGSRVYPVEEGTVYFAGSYKGYGEMVAVDHGNGYVTIYGHNSRVLVKPGDRVQTTTVLALSGSTGRSTGPHVHYELRQVPGYEKQRRAAMEANLQKLVGEAVEGVVKKELQGQGGGEFFLPEKSGSVD
jgi:murein DD-endopeptidase MepM/ murein hydrolase activator NlpD